MDILGTIRKALLVRGLAFAILLISSHTAWGYADFIGYGYRSCTVCHVSGAGGGMLTDYGRALFATEIASKPLWINFDDETLGEYSKFLGKVDLPWWLKLGYKFRQLTAERNPGSDLSRTGYYEMQNDLNTQIIFDKKQTLSFVTTLGYAHEPKMVFPNKTIGEDVYFFFREYYAKWIYNRTNTFYLGLMDKTFGIRHPDHTSISRSNMGLGQNDQVHSFLWHNADPIRDIYAQVWIGNTWAEKENRYAGGSFMYEREVGNQFALGGEAFYEMKSDSSRYAVATHFKKGFNNGNSFIGELGYYNLKIDDSPEVKRIYSFTQGHLKLVRGLYLESSGEYWKVSGDKAENLRWALGFLWFPMQRVELRATAQQQKSLNTDPTRGDTWFYLTQLHLSL